MSLVIGLAGVKTSGKSTVANMIKELMDEENILESALADKLKNVCAEVFEIPRENFDRQDLKEVPLGESKILGVMSIHKILNLFNVPVTQKLMAKYEESKIIDMELPTPRKIAQIVGTEVLRTTGDEDIHCKNMPMNENGTTIVSDLRFPNEFAYFSNLGTEGVRFLPLYIQREEAEKHVTEDSHPSETSVFKFNMHCKKVSNNGTLKELKEQLRLILKNEGYIEEKSKGA